MLTSVVTLILISSFALVTSFKNSGVRCQQSVSVLSSCRGGSFRRSEYRSTQMSATIDDEVSEKKFYGFRSLAGQGIPSPKLIDPLAVQLTKAQEEAFTFTTTFSPTITAPSIPSASSGFKDIPSISSTASPSLDSTLSFNSGKPKSQAIFTLLNRMKEFNFKVKLTKKVKTATWDSPRFVQILQYDV
jgi:hypothetical protein